MTTYRNEAKGARGVLLLNDTYVMIEPGETKSVPGDRIKSVPDGLVAVNASEASPRVVEGGEQAELPPPPSSLQQLDHDGDGKPGGSLAHEPPALSGMTKAQLTEQAEAEGVIIEQIKGTGANGNVLADDIKAAIEAKRAAQS